MSVDLVRDTAIGVLLRVFEKGSYLSIALDASLRRRDVSDRGRRFLTQLVYGTVRHKLLCDYVLTPLVNQKLDSLPAPILAILRMGVFQALFLRQVTFPSMVHTSVDLAKRRGHAGTARLANAVLRRVPQTLDTIRFPSRDADPAAYLSVYHSMPRWLVDEWMAEHGVDGTEALCAASNTEAPVTLRANLLKTTPEQLTAALAKSDCLAKQTTPVPEELTLIEGAPPARSKLFLNGHFTVQDPASMLPVHLLEPKPGDRVLDVCAAPGGKTTHIAECSEGRAWIVAMDVNVHRLGLVLENASRLGIEDVALVCGDGTAPPLQEGFDRILVDAPCTGLGTLRRHPDLKWRVTPQMRREVAERQIALLRSAIRLCKNGGLVVYSVCTFSREETLDVAQAILQTEPVRPEAGPEWLEAWKTNPGQYQTLPTKEGWDGFFLMRLRKVS